MQSFFIKKLQVVLGIWREPMSVTLDTQPSDPVPKDKSGTNSNLI